MTHTTKSFPALADIPKLLAHAHIIVAAKPCGCRVAARLNDQSANTANLLSDWIKMGRKLLVFYLDQTIKLNHCNHKKSPTFPTSEYPDHEC